MVDWEGLGVCGVVQRIGQAWATVGWPTKFWAALSPIGETAWWPWGVWGWPAVDWEGLGGCGVVQQIRQALPIVGWPTIFCHALSLT